MNRKPKLSPSMTLTQFRHAVLQLLPAAMAGRLRAWQVQRMITGFSPRVVEHTFGTVRLKAYLADPLSEGWYDHDWVPLPELEAMRTSRLTPGARVFDLGAHQGVVAMMIAREVGPDGQVIAVEANPHNCSAARKNRELNGLSQIVVVHAAVADRAGTLTFNAGLNGQIDDGSGAGGRFEVASITIDDLATRFGMPDVVFLDVEGAECLALAGARRVLASGADCFVEAHVGCGLEKLGGSAAQLLSYFPRDRFSLLIRQENDEAFRPLQENDPFLAQRFFLLARRPLRS